MLRKLKACPTISDRNQQAVDANKSLVMVMRWGSCLE